MPVDGRYGVQLGERSAKVDAGDRVRLEKLEEDVDEIKRDVKEIGEWVYEIRLKQAADEQRTELMKADRNHHSARQVALISLLGVLLTVVASALTAYVTRPEPQVVTAPMSPELREALKLIEQREGYKLGKLPPAE